MTEVWTSPRHNAERERQQRHLAFEAIWQATRYDGLTEQTGFELLRRVEPLKLMSEEWLDEARGQELLAEVRAA